MLEPFQKTTEALSRYLASIFQVVPLINVSKTELNNHKADKEVQSAKEVMLVSIEKRFNIIYTNQH